MRVPAGPNLLFVERELVSTTASKRELTPECLSSVAHLEVEMIDRRDFGKLMLAFVAATSARNLRAAGAGRALGVQLYTVRDQAEKDLAGALAAIRKIGYDEIETYGNVHERPARELRKVIEDAGLRVPSGHFNYEGLHEKLDYAKELGVQYVICPMLPKGMQDDLDGFAKAADQFNKWGEQANQRGLRFGFHNHNYEFQKFGTTTGYETLLQRTDPKLVCFELDCFWAAHAGHDPAHIISQHGNRIALLHMKDRHKGAPVSTRLESTKDYFTEVGAGTIDWRRVVEAANKAGIKHLFVEKDTSEIPPLESLKISYEKLHSLV